AVNGSILYGTRYLRVVQLDAEGKIPDNPEWYGVNTPQQANVQPQIVTGQQQELRGGDRLIATITESDEVSGVDISFQDAVLDGKFLSIVAGGTYDESTKTYTPPAMGEAKPKFAAELYVAEYEEGSSEETDVVGYTVFRFGNCSATIPQFQAQGRAFLAPQFTFRARDGRGGVRFMTFQQGVQSLPQDNGNAEDGE